MTALIKEINKLTLSEKVVLIERTLKSMRTENAHGDSLSSALNELYVDYKTDKDLTAFTHLDTQSFYEAS